MQRRSLCIYRAAVNAERAIGCWLACARKFWLPIILMVIALHVSHLFPKGTEVYGDFSGILKKKDIQRVEERIEKVRAEDTTPQE